MEHLSAFEQKIYNIMALKRKFYYYTLLVNLILIIVFIAKYLNPEKNLFTVLLFVTLVLWLGYYIFKFVYFRMKIGTLNQEFTIVKEHTEEAGVNFEPGEQVTLGEESDKYQGWYLCTNEKGSGYIHSRYLYRKKTGECFVKGKFATNELGVNIGDKVKVIGYASSWVYITHNDKEGWILADCLEVK